MEKSLKNKIVVVTGASRGIGFEDAKLFLQEGARVAFCANIKSEVLAAERRLKKFGEVFAMATDVRREGDIKKFAQAILKKFDRIDILVNNAGILPPGDLVEQKFSLIDDVIDTNLKGVLKMTRAFLPQMVMQKRGVIINISSVAGMEGYAGMAVYCATKFGIRGFSEALNEELQDRGIRVYSICPGAVATTMNSKFTGDPAVGIPPEQVAKLLVKIAKTQPKANRCFEP